MNLTFTIQEMSEALTKIGYRVVTEKVTATFRTYNDQTEDEEVSVTNCYYNGDHKPSAEWAGYGTRRLEYVFKEELTKKLLKLF